MRDHSGRVLRSILDLSADEIRGVLDRASELEAGAEAHLGRGVLSLLFFSSSLRTAAGLAAAGVRLGLTPVQFGSVRHDADMSAGESLEDTLRTIAGYSSVVAYRGDDPCPAAVRGGAAVLNAGDGGADPEHPSQTLCDLFAIQREVGDLADLRIGVCGDLTMRATRSLLRQFGRTPPAHLVLIAPPGRSGHGVELPADLSSRVEHRDAGDFSGLDCLYLTGLPERRGGSVLDAEARSAFALDEYTVNSLDREAVVLSPMPVIDEIAPQLRSDPRVRLFGPSDRALHVRVALLELLLSGSTPNPPSR